MVLVLLSLRLSRRVFSPLTAPVLASPAGGLADPEATGTVASRELPVVDDPSAEDGGFGEEDPLSWLLSTSSIQSAGVGGTGPSVVGRGRRVGGDVIGSLPPLLVRDMLCDRAPAGGGPGGGGGMGMPGSHGTCGPVRDLAEVGVSMAPMEAARRDPGATLDAESGSDVIGAGRGGIWSLRWCAGRLRADDMIEAGAAAEGET